MSPKELIARTELSKNGPLTDPRYMRDPKNAEGKLKENVRDCWKHKEHFPDWLKAYVKKWTQERDETSRLKVRKAQPATVQDDHRTGIPSDVEGSALG